MLRLWIVVFVFLGGYLSAQLPSNSIGNNPSSQRWSQINTERVQVVFPNGQEESGLRVAQLINFLWDHETPTIGQKKHKVSIFLQGGRTLSNGLVTVGPFRSEFYQTPPQFANSTSYLDLLTIHEYRHVQQFANATQGVTKLAKNIFGSWAWGGMMALALPRWYFEGDAVVAETIFSRSGRGRLPSFNMQYYAWYDAQKEVGYEKASAGSLQEYVPDWYPLGYHMLTYGQQKYGDDLWKKVAEDAVKYKGLFVPFAKSIKRHTGLTTKELYRNTMSDGLKKWKENTQGAKSYIAVNKVSKHTVTNYTTPIPWVRSLIVEKSSYDQIGAFYKIDPHGNESKIVDHGVLIDGVFSSLSLDNNKLCWAELGFDPRWRYRQWSNIYIYDAVSQEKKQLTSKTRYFSPALRSKVNKILAVEITPEQVNQLVIINSTTGEKELILENKQNYLLSHPQWISDEEVVVIASKNEESHILSFNLRSKVNTSLSTPSPHQLSHIHVHDGDIFFAASFGIFNNIYVLRKEDQSIHRITNSKVGAFQPNVNSEGVLYFSEFSARGFDIKKINLNEHIPVLYEPYIRISKRSQSDEEYTILEDLPVKDFKIEKYNKWSGLLRPHSIVAEINDPFATVKVLSDNKFSTMSAEVGATLNYNEDEWTYYAGLRYAEFYPIINASYAKSYRSSFLFNFQGLTDTSLVQTFYVERWSENRITSGVTLPYNFSKGNMSNNLSLRANYQYATIDVEGRFDDPETPRDTFAFGEQGRQRLSSIYQKPFSNGSISTLDVSFSLSMIQRRALQHIQPRLGFVFFQDYVRILQIII